jgi:uncharacterized membrane protein
MDSSVPLRRKNTRGMRVLLVMGAITIVTLGSILIYWPVISINNPSSIPWGSDTLGHVSRFEFLAKSMQRGIYMPDIYPSWYLGIQLFRYYPSLTYFLLIFINSITRQSVLAVNWCIFLCALFGGLSFLLYKKWIGWLPAIAGGLIYLLLPDNVRVAFSEGNIPRVLATAFVPLLFYFILSFRALCYEINQLLDSVNLIVMDNICYKLVHYSWHGAIPWRRYINFVILCIS